MTKMIKKLLYFGCCLVPVLLRAVDQIHPRRSPDLLFVTFAKHPLHDSETIKANQFYVNPVAVLVKDIPDKQTNLFPQSSPSAANSQLAVNAFSRTNGFINVTCLLLGIGTTATLLAGWYTHHYFTHSSSTLRKMASTLITATCVLATSGLGQAFAEGLQFKAQLSNKYPFPVPANICELLNIPLAQRHNYRCEEPKFRHLNTLITPIYRNTQNTKKALCIFVDDFVRK